MSANVWNSSVITVDVAPNLSLADIQICFLLAPEAAEDVLDFESTVWFTITNARPERKAQVRVDHVARQKALWW